MKTRARADYEYNGNDDRYWDNSSTRQQLEYEESDEEEGNEVGDEDNEISEANE